MITHQQAGKIVGDPYKPSFPTVTGKGPHPSYIPFLKWFWSVHPILRALGVTPSYTTRKNMKNKNRVLSENGSFKDDVPTLF